MGAGLTFRTERGWDRRGTYLERNEEVFDAEVFAILQAFRLLNKRGGQGQQYAVFSDSQAAIARAQHDGTGPAQALARAAIAVVDDLTSRGNPFTLRWAPAHMGVEGNEQADATAKEAAERRGQSRVNLPFGGQPVAPRQGDYGG